MTNQLTVYNRTTQLLATDSTVEIKEAARKLMRLTPGGNRLDADQATDLAVYAFLTGLNPFNNECYYMPKVGPIPGIAGYRTKAIEWLAATNPRAVSPRTWEEYRPATTEEADFNPEAGDVAWVCILYDSVSQEAWEQRLIKLGTGYHQMGATFKEAHDAALADIGPRPSWTAVGVVKSEEHFSGNVYRNNVKIDDEFKPEMFDRNERAKKRAAKLCYRKGFTEINIPDREEGDTINVETHEIKTRVLAELASENAPAPRRSAAVILDELGYDAETKPEQAPAPAPSQPETPMNGAPRPYLPETLRSKLSEQAKWFESKTSVASEMDRKMIPANMTKCFAGENDASDKYHTVLKYLTGKESSKGLSDYEVLALKKWLHCTQDSGGEWVVDPMAVTEAHAVFTAALKMEGQEPIPF